MHRPPLQVTRDGALTWAREQSDDPDSVRPVPHPEFESDPDSGGFAFVDETRLYILCRNGSRSTGLLDSGPPPHQRIDDMLSRNRHAARPLVWDELGPWQRAAVTATRAGTTVAHLPPDRRPGIDTDPDRDHADWIWIALDRHRADPLRVLAADDALLAPPPARRTGPRTHPCPLCDRPAPHMDRYPRAVCNACRDRTADSSGRRITGYNTSMSGGFEARYVTDDGTTDEICAEITRTGRCWVDGHECSIGEARFGGVVVEAR